MSDEATKSTDQVSDSSPIVGHIREKFQQSETSRIYDEKRWLKAYRNYRVVYGPEMAFRSNEKSRVNAVPVIVPGKIIPDNNIPSVLIPDELLASADTSIVTLLANDLLKR